MVTWKCWEPPACIIKMGLLNVPGPWQQRRSTYFTLPCKHSESWGLGGILSKLRTNSGIWGIVHSWPGVKRTLKVRKLLVSHVDEALQATYSTEARGLQADPRIHLSKGSNGCLPHLHIAQPPIPTHLSLNWAELGDSQLRWNSQWEAYSVPDSMNQSP